MTTICEAHFPIAWRTVSARRHATVRRVFDMLQMATANQAWMMHADGDMHSYSGGGVLRSLGLLIARDLAKKTNNSGTLPKTTI